MNREVRDKTEYRPRPVRKIELDGSRPVARLILVCVLLAVGITAIGAGIKAFLTPDTGWTEIEPASSEQNCSADFVFLYNLGKDGKSAAAEKKELTILYSDVCEKAVPLFSVYGVSAAEGGLLYLNEHPNEPVTMDPAVFKALEDVSASGSRYPYLAPVFEQYNTVFNCSSDAEAENFMPEKNPDLAEYFEKVVSFSNDAESIDLILNDDGTACLKVSREYMDFAAQNGITVFFDLFALKNAFIADYIAAELTQRGFVSGTLSSYDGFTCCLDCSGESFSFNCYELREGRPVLTGTEEYTGPLNSATLRAFPVMESKEYYWYRTEDGRYITALIDPATGRFDPTSESVTEKSAELSCGRLALKAYTEIAR